MVYVSEISDHEPMSSQRVSIEILETLVGLDVSVGIVGNGKGLALASPAVADASDRGQIQFLDLFVDLGELRIAAIRQEARRKATVAEEEVEAFLDPGVRLHPEGLETVVDLHVAQRLWQRLRASVRCDLVVIRDPLSPLGVVVAWHEIETGTKTVSFQHGVVSGVHHYVPVLGSTHLTHGPRSAQFLTELNNTLAQRLLPHHPSMTAIGNYQYGTDVHHQPGKRQILILDQTNKWAGEYYGCAKEMLDLAEIAEQAIRKGIARHVTVRPHPRTRVVESWSRLKEEFATRLTISHPATPLSTDLAEATVAVTLFSGAGIAAGASRVPVLFVGNRGRPWTADLEDFAELTVSPEGVLDSLNSMMMKPSTVEEHSEMSFTAAKRYFGEQTPAALPHRNLEDHLKISSS